MKIKAINKSLSITIITGIALGQIGCATPGGTTDQTKKPDTTSQSQKVIGKLNTLLLTQKSAAGVTNPIVPEDIESITVNGKVYKASDIKIEKGLAIKAVDYFLKFVNGRFVIEGSDGDVELNISFKLKDSPNQIVLPDFALLALTGDLRIEFAKNDKGEIIGVNGGFNANGSLDTTKPMFTFDPVSGKLDVISNGMITSYVLELEDVKTEMKIKTQIEPKTLTPEELKAQQKNIDVDKPSAGAPFVGKWKYDLLGTGIRLTLMESANSQLNYSASIFAVLQNYKGEFGGNVNYTSAGNNTLNIESAVNGKPIKGMVQLVGDNALNFSLISTDISEIKNFVGQSLSLSRDVN